VQTTIDESIKARAGVCQDYARAHSRRALPLLRHSGALRERLHLQRSGGPGAGRRGVARPGAKPISAGTAGWVTTPPTTR
jgi:hypothetical protein